MGFKEVMLGVVIGGLFLFSMVSFGANLAYDNNASSNILDDPSIAPLNSTLRSNLGELESTAQGQREVFEQQEAQGGTDEGFSLTSIVSIIKTFFGSSIGTINIILNTVAQTIGVPAVILNIIVGGLIITLLLLGWRVIRAGGT